MNYIRYALCVIMSKFYSAMSDYTRNFKKRPYYLVKSEFYSMAARGHYSVIMNQPFVLK